MFLPSSQYVRATLEGADTVNLPVGSYNYYRSSSAEVFAVPRGSEGLSRAIPLPTAVVDLEGSEPVYVRACPTQADYDRGYVDRYVVYGVQSRKITEVDVPGYEQFSRSRFYRTTVISWYITGPADNFIDGNFRYPGVRANNADVLDQADRTIPGIAVYFSDLTEFLENSPSDFDPAKCVRVIEPPELPDTSVDTDDADRVIEPPELPDIVFDPIDFEPVPMIEDPNASEDVQVLLGAFEEEEGDIIEEQMEIAAKLEAELKAQNEQDTREARRSAIRRYIESTRRDLTDDIVTYSTRISMKRARGRRIDEQRDFDKLKTLMEGLFNDPENFTAGEVIAVANETKLKNRLRLETRGRALYVRFRDVRDKSFYRNTHEVLRLNREQVAVYGSTLRQPEVAPSELAEVTLNENEVIVARELLFPHEQKDKAFEDRRAQARVFMREEKVHFRKRDRVFDLSIARANVVVKMREWRASMGLL